MQAPESMSRRGLRLIIDDEGQQSHGGSLALSARFIWRFQQASPLVKNSFSIRSRSRFRGRSEMSTQCGGGPQGVWHQKFWMHRRVGLATPMRSKNGALSRGQTGESHGVVRLGSVRLNRPG